MTRFRAVVVGCGGRAPDHIDAYEHIADAEVVACCAPSGRRRDPLAAKYGLHAYSSAEEMIRAEKPDIVHLITWPDLRAELMTLVSDLGVPLCTVEKPVAAGVADWKQLTELEAASATKFAVCHQFRWHPDMVQCQEAMASGALGRPLLLDISAGLNLAGQGTHTLNYGRALIGDPRVTRVFGNVSGWDSSDPGHAAPKASEAMLLFENGARGIWTSGDVAPRCGDPDVVWQHVRCLAHAEHGRINFEEFGRWDVIAPGDERGGGFAGMAAWRDKNILAQAGFHRAMFDWFDDGLNAPGTSLALSLHEWSVVLALYQSSLERRPVEMQGFDPPDDLIERVAGLRI